MVSRVSKLVEGMDKKGAQNPSVLTVKELQASLNYKEKAKSDVHKRRYTVMPESFLNRQMALYVLSLI
jgi:hypothetical protein